MILNSQENDLFYSALSVFTLIIALQIPKTPLVQQKLTIAISPKLSGCRASSAPARRQRVHHTVAEEVRH